MRKQSSLACFLLILGVLFAATACKDGSTGSYFSYRESNFHAEIQGELNGVSFTAEIGRTGTEDGATLYVTYLSPEALNGLTVTQNAGGEVSVSLDGITPGTETVQSLIAPLQALFEGEEILTVQKNGQTTTLQTAPDQVLTLSSHTPLSFTSPTLTFTVLWWETA